MRICRVKQVKTDLDPATMGMDLRRVERAITKNTIAVYASAPTFTHGVVDPISELSELLTVRLVTHGSERRPFYFILFLLAFAVPLLFPPRIFF